MKRVFYGYLSLKKKRNLSIVAASPDSGLKIATVVAPMQSAKVMNLVTPHSLSQVMNPHSWVVTPYSQWVASTHNRWPPTHSLTIHLHADGYSDSQFLHDRSSTRVHICIILYYLFYFCFLIRFWYKFLCFALFLDTFKLMYAFQ